MRPRTWKALPSWPTHGAPIEKEWNAASGIMLMIASSSAGVRYLISWMDIVRASYKALPKSFKPLEPELRILIVLICS